MFASVMELLFFILLSIGLIVTPGPNVLVVVSTSIAYGKLRGLQTVAGTASAMALQLLLAALGTSWLVTNLAAGFVWLKWLGVIYLCYLGVSHLLFARRTQAATPVSAMGSFMRGFLVSLTNPKTILFFGAFLPQFVQPAAPYLPQITLLSAIFWLLALLSDSGYVLLASKFRTLLRGQKIAKTRNTFTGVLYLGAGATLAVTRNS